MTTPSFEQLFDLTQGAIIVLASRLLPLPAATRSFYREPSPRGGTNKGCRDDTLARWMNAAELELTAFLEATSQVAADLPPEKVSDLWIDVLNMTEWNGDEPEQFFRLISILAAAKVSGVAWGSVNASGSLHSFGRTGAAAHPKSGHERAGMVRAEEQTYRVPEKGEERPPV